MDIVDLIEEYYQKHSLEKEVKASFLSFTASFERNLWASRSNVLGHFTSSCWIVNRSNDKVLLVYHPIYKSWSWLGGHADGELDIRKCVLKESSEETGLLTKDFYFISEKPISLDVLTVFEHKKNFKTVSAHLHFNFTYLFVLEENKIENFKVVENNKLQWIAKNNLQENISEEHMHPVYNKILLKVQEFLANNKIIDNKFI